MNKMTRLLSQADFCNPGLLSSCSVIVISKPCFDHYTDDYTTFRRVYEVPILKSRAPGASEKEIKLGEARAEQVVMPVNTITSANVSHQLLAVSKSFVLRREATILENYLPPKCNVITGLARHFSMLMSKHRRIHRLRYSNCSSTVDFLQDSSPRQARRP